MEETELANKWWAASEAFRAERDWTITHGKLASMNNRVLILGPGENDSAFRVTKAMALFLTRAGLAPETLSRESDPAAHRLLARDFIWIFALPISVGSCAEVLDFAHRSELRDRMSVLLPEEFSGGYFARVIGYDNPLQTRICGSVANRSPEAIHENIGLKLLLEVTRYVRKIVAMTEARVRTEGAPKPSSVQAREGGVMPHDEEYLMQPGQGGGNNRDTSSTSDRFNRMGAYSVALLLITLIAFGVATKVVDAQTSVLAVRSAIALVTAILVMFVSGEFHLSGKLGPFEVRAVAGFAVLVTMLWLLFFSSVAGIQSGTGKSLPSTADSAGVHRSP